MYLDIHRGTRVHASEASIHTAESGRVAKHVEHTPRESTKQSSRGIARLKRDLSVCTRAPRTRPHTCTLISGMDRGGFQWMYDTPRFTLTLTYFKSFRRYAKRKSRGIDHFDSSKLTKTIQFAKYLFFFWSYNIVAKKWYNRSLAGRFRNDRRFRRKVRESSSKLFALYVTRGN